MRSAGRIGQYLAGRAAGCRVVRAEGVESEMELAFAGLHQLLAPMLGRLDRLSAPQREALRTAFGLSEGPAPDRFLVGLAVLRLVSEVASERPLVCVVDDEQWLDRASVQVLGFVARRLAADPVGLVFAARVAGAELAGLPELAVEGLGEDDARALLDSALTGPLDARVRDLIIAETRGTRWRCWSCRAAFRRRSWRAGSDCPARCRCRAGSRTASGGSSAVCRPRPGACWRGQQDDPCPLGQSRPRRRRPRDPRQLIAIPSRSATQPQDN
jgi:hypothetical protein